MGGGLPAHPLSSEARRRLGVKRIPAAGGQELFCLTTTTTTSSSAARTERALYVPGVFPISTEQQHLRPSEDQNSCFLLFLAFFDPDARDQFAQKIPIFQFFHLSLCSIKASDNFLSPPFLGLGPSKKATCIFVRENTIWAFKFFPRAAKF